MLKYSNKLLSVLLALAIFAALFTGCNSGNDSGASATAESAAPAQESAAVQQPASSALEAKPIVRVGALKGPTAMGMAALMEENSNKKSKNIYEFTVAGAPDEIAGKIVTGEIDIAAIPTNLASVLYNKTDKKVSVLAVNTLGVLSILTKDADIASVKDLKGETIYATGQGATPEYVLNYILSQNGLDPAEDVTIEYFSEHTELASKILAGSANIAMLPQPFVTTVTAKDAEVKNALDLTQEWDAVSGGTELVMGCIVVRNEFLEKNPAAIDSFLNEYKASTDYVNENVDEAAALVGKYDILAEDIAKKAIPACNIVYLDGDGMKASMSAFLQVLSQQNPASVGGALPDDAFYYKK